MVMAATEQPAKRTHALLEVDSEEESRPSGRRRRSQWVTGGMIMVVGFVAMGCLAWSASHSERKGPGLQVTKQISGLAELTLVEHGGKKAGDLPLVSHGAVPEEDKQCAWGKQNCNSTRCCNNAGMKCYAQHSYYAQCRSTCTRGPDPAHWDGLPWSCEELGERAPGSSQCSALGEDCSKTQCCSEANTQCFEKAPGWAACKKECAADGPDLTDADGHYWSCKKLGPRAAGPAPWVAEQCAADGEDCRKAKCCKTPGAQCYEQSKDWGSCKFDCTAGKDPQRSWEPAWSCKELGLRTPGTGPASTGVVSKWVGEKCAWDGTDCKGSRCCIGMNRQCYRKNDNWAMCMESCTAGPHKEDNNETWSCQPLGPRSQGLALKGSPSLFCWSLFQTTSYEMAVLQNQLTKHIGIFQCDGYVTISTAEPTFLGKDAEGEDVTSLHADMAEITTSVDGTAGNAALFINCWNVIVSNGRWNNYAWTVKVDPDAVLVPDRLRSHLAPHVLENVYVLNCNAYPSSPEFPMMYGALEILSWKAMDTYRKQMWLCMQDMAAFIPLWGEDRFMKKCLDHIGVGTIQDFSAVGDGVCTGVDCGNSFVAAFHPFKSVDLWQQCWDIAHR